MQAFVYRWREKTTRMWYIGYHKGNSDDGYICSSKIVKPKIKINPNNWERKILRSGSKEEMIKLEKRLLKLLNARDNIKSYNKHNGNGHSKLGRLKGSKNNLGPYSDLHPKNLNKLSSMELILMLKNEADPIRRCLLFGFILSKV